MIYYITVFQCITDKWAEKIIPNERLEIYIGQTAINSVLKEIILGYFSHFTHHFQDTQ